MRVMLVIAGLNMGGAERLLVDHAQRLVETGDDVIVVSLLPGGALLDEANSTGARVVSLGFRRGRPSARGALQYLKLLRSAKPDVVHASMFHANLLARLARLFVPSPVVLSSVHNVNERGDRPRHSRGLRLRMAAYRFTDRLSELTSHVSEQGATDYVRARTSAVDRMRFVPNGTDLGRFRMDSAQGEAMRQNLGLSSEDRVLITVGALTAQKNQAALIEAFANVASGTTSLKLLVVGGGELSADLAEQCNVLGVSDRVQLLGLRSDIPNLMWAADVFVLPSRFEGMPVVILEAFAARLPVLATRVGSVPQLVTKQTGWLVEPEDPAELERALMEVCEADPIVLSALGESASELVSARFGADRYSDRWRRLYVALVGCNARRLAPAAGGVADEVMLADVRRSDVPE